MRVTFVRGRRDVRVSPPVPSSADDLVRGGVLAPLDVSDVDGVVDDAPGLLISLVTGGLVLVMVCVVLGLDVLVAVAENDGST